LAALIGIKLFHNHWTVNLLTAVCPPASETWNRLAPRIRLDVFHEGARVGVDLVLTSASRAADPEEVERVRTLTVMSDR
jgi:hypothetical protein